MINTLNEIQMDYVNVDAMGKEYRYSSEQTALNMSQRLPYAWRLIALAVPKLEAVNHDQ